jgi:acyl carrier protein
MNRKKYTDIKNFFFELLAYIKPGISFDEDSLLSIFELDDVDYTFLAIELEEKYSASVEEDALRECFSLKDVVTYIYTATESE